MPRPLRSAGPLAAIVVGNRADTEPLRIRQLNGLTGVVQGADEIAKGAGDSVAGLHGALVTAHHQVVAIADKGTLGKDEADSPGKTIAREIIRFRTIVEYLNELELRLGNPVPIGRVEMNFGNDDFSPGGNGGQEQKQKIDRRRRDRSPQCLCRPVIVIHRTLF